jgi:hypothetical protein
MKWKFTWDNLLRLFRKRVPEIFVPTPLKPDDVKRIIDKFHDNTRGFSDTFHEGLMAWALHIWWVCGVHVLWNIDDSAADQVSRTSIKFIPDRPPSSWDAAVILVDARGRRLMPSRSKFLPDVTSISATYCRSSDSSPMYTFVVLSDGGESPNSVSFSINAGVTLDKEAFTEPLPDSEVQICLAIVRWLFAFSYYIADPLSETRQVGSGPLEQTGVTRRGKSSPKGRQPLWTYRTLHVSKLRRERTGEPGTAIDTSNLNRGLAVVGPHWQRVGKDWGEGKEVRLFQEYVGHRWRRPGLLGTKVRVVDEGMEQEVRHV